MKIFLSVFLLWFWGFLVFADAAEKSKTEYWKEAGLSFEMLRRDVINLKRKNGEVTESICYPGADSEDELAMIACLVGVNQALQEVDASYVYLPKGKKIPGIEIKKILQEFNVGAIYELADLKTDVAKDEVKKQVLQRYQLPRLLLEQWSQYFIEAIEQKKADSELFIPFDAIIDWVDQRLPDPERRIEAAANTINQYLAVYFGDNTHIEPEAFLEQEFKSNGDSFVGIGAELKVVDQLPVVIRPVEGSPAEAAGLQPLDIVVAVDGWSTKDKKLDEVVKKIRGPQAKAVVLTILRDGNELLIKIIRGKIETPLVLAKLLEKNGKKQGYIKLSTFMSEKACPSIKAAIQDFAGKKAEGIILDLRNNGGGLLDQATCIAGLFLRPGTLVTETRLIDENLHKLGFRDKQETAFGNYQTSLPLVILQNGSSASASELLTGALADHGRAIVIGHRSFGKGTVQSPITTSLPLLRNLENVDLFTTISRFYQPSGTSNQLNGIHPHLEVFSAPDSKDEGMVLRQDTVAFKPISGDGGAVIRSLPARLQICVEKGPAKADFQPKQAATADYQLLVAKDMLTCMAQEKITGVVVPAKAKSATLKKVY